MTQFRVWTALSESAIRLESVDQPEYGSMDQNMAGIVKALGDFDRENHHMATP